MRTKTTTPLQTVNPVPITPKYRVHHTGNQSWAEKLAQLRNIVQNP